MAPPPLPQEIWAMILQFTARADLPQARLTCRSFCNLAEEFAFQSLRITPENWKRKQRIIAIPALAQCVRQVVVANCATSVFLSRPQLLGSPHDPAQRVFCEILQKCSNLRDIWIDASDSGELLAPFDDYRFEGTYDVDSLGVSLLEAFQAVGLGKRQRTIAVPMDSVDCLFYLEMDNVLRNAEQAPTANEVKTVLREYSICRPDPENAALVPNFGPARQNDRNDMCTVLNVDCNYIRYSANEGVVAVASQCELDDHPFPLAAYQFKSFVMLKAMPNRLSRRLQILKLENACFFASDLINLLEEQPRLQLLVLANGCIHVNTLYQWHEADFDECEVHTWFQLLCHLRDLNSARRPQQIRFWGTMHAAGLPAWYADDEMECIKCHQRATLGWKASKWLPQAGTAGNETGGELLPTHAGDVDWLLRKFIACPFCTYKEVTA